MINLDCLYLCRNLKLTETNTDTCQIPTLNHPVFGTCIEKIVTNNYYDLCKTEYCPMECDSFTYYISVNTIFKGEYLALFIYFDSLKYTWISQEPKIELFGLVSNLGGILGLFILLVCWNYYRL